MASIVSTDRVHTRSLDSPGNDTPVLVRHPGRPVRCVSRRSDGAGKSAGDHVRINCIIRREETQDVMIVFVRVG